MKNLLVLLILGTQLIISQTQYRFNINNINLPIDNKGVLAAVNIPPNGPLGRFGVGTFLYSAGFMVSGYNADTLWACAEATASLIENFVPGNVDSNQSNPIYKIYVNNSSSFPDYSAWQDYVNAVNSGASFYDGDGDSVYNPVDLNSNGQWDPNEDKPDIIGDKMTWCVYNDGVPGNQRTRFAGVNPVGLEIHQSLFGYTSITLGNVIFIRYELLNTGKANTKLDSVYFSTWADPDLGTDFEDDLVGSDFDRNSGFVYNENTNDPAYGISIPSFFIRFLEGPVSYIPGETFVDNNFNDIYDDGVDTPLDTAYNRKGKDLGVKQIPGAKNLDISSFVHYIQSDPLRGDPNSVIEARNYMKGRLKLGEIFNPCSSDSWGGVFGGVDCNLIDPNYWYAGNPNTQTGWLNTVGTDQRILINTGPFDLEVGKKVSIIVAYIVGQGANPLESITKAKEIAEYTHNFYISNFGEFPVGVDEDPIVQLPDDFKLEQNYPNPFNPSTKISWQSPVSSHQTLKVYDVLGNEVTTLVNEFRDAGSYEIIFNASKLSSGIYFYELKAGNNIQTKKMILLQ